MKPICWPFLVIRACETQVRSVAGAIKPYVPPQAVSTRPSVRPRSSRGNEPFNQMTWRALLRKLDRIAPDYRLDRRHRIVRRAARRPAAFPHRLKFGDEDARHGARPSPRRRCDLSPLDRLEALYRRYPVPDVFAKTRWKWSPDEIRDFQNEQFLDLMKTGWRKRLLPAPVEDGWSRGGRHQEHRRYRQAADVRFR